MITVKAVATSLVIIASSLALNASAASCSNKSLKGTYLYSNEGYINSQPAAQSGKEIYDGKGNITLSYADGGSSILTATGTYTINSDCTGSSSYTDGTKYNIFVAPNGSTFSFTLVSPNAGTVQSGTETRVSSSIK